MKYVRLYSISCYLLLLVVLPYASLAQPINVTTLFPDKDNTLIESPTGSFSNGASASLFVGRVGTQGDFTLRRAVLHFDLEAHIPQGESILKGQLKLTVTRTPDNNAYTFTLHRLLTDWGEGTSNASGGIGALSTQDDATWIHSFYPDIHWATPGGDFVDTPSAEIEMGSPGTYLIDNAPGVLEDLNFWQTHPEQNFGWVLIGNESGLAFAVKQIGSRESDNEEARPTLVVEHIDPTLPVELEAFDGLVDGDAVILQWRTASELNNAGFSVEKKTNGVFNQIGFVQGAGTTLNPQQYRFDVPSLSNGVHEFRLKQIDFDGSYALSPVVRSVVDLADVPARLFVYPTPFNPQTTVHLSVERAQDVVVAVFDVLGRQVREIARASLEAHVAYVFQFDAAGLPSGTYLIRTQGDTFVLHQAVVYQK